MSEPRTATEIAENDDRWRHYLAHRYAADRPPSWWPNQKLRPISLQGIPLLAIDPDLNRLYWNGEEIQTRRTLRLEGASLVAAWIAAIGAFGLFALSLVDRFL